MIRGFSVGTAAYVLSYLLPFTTVAIAGIGYGCWYLHARQTAAMEYAQALENLISCYTWTLGRKQAANIEDAVCINQMINALAPLTTNKQLLKIADTEYHGAISQKATAMRRQTVIDGHRLNKEEQDLCYGLYGYKQGGFFAVLQVISYLFRYSYSALTKVMPWYKKTVDPIEEESRGMPAISMSM